MFTDSISRAICRCHNIYKEIQAWYKVCNKKIISFNEIKYTWEIINVAECIWFEIFFVKNIPAFRFDNFVWVTDYYEKFYSKMKKQLHWSIDRRKLKIWILIPCNYRIWHEVDKFETVFLVYNSISSISVWSNGSI